MVFLGKIIIGIIILPALLLFCGAVGAGIFYSLRFLFRKCFKRFKF